MTTDRAWADYTASFREHVLSHLVESAYMLTIAEDWSVDTLDLRAATEVGLAVLLDKPLIIVVPPGQTIPAALRRAAAVVLDGFDVGNPGDQDRIAEALRGLMEHP